MRQDVLNKIKGNFCDKLEAGGYDACWIVKPENVRYLTGFHGEDSTLVVAHGNYYLITDSRYREEAGNEAFIDELVGRTGSMALVAGNICKKVKAKNLCITAANVNCADYKYVSESGGGLQVALRRNGLVEEMRKCKKPHEIKKIERAVSVAETGFKKFNTHIETGRSEKWLSGRLAWDLIQSGADGPAFESICAIEEHGSRPHSRPTDRVLAQGEGLLIDWGANVGGYNSDLTRMIALDKMPAKLNELSNIIIGAQQAALEVLEPGVEALSVDAAARNFIEKAGYGQFFSHGLGHGLGLEVHEAPSLAPGRKECLQPGMVVTIEPGIYIPGEFGARIEEMVHITENGYRRLSGLERKPLCL